MYLLNENMLWETIQDHMEVGRVNHCQIQINDLEVAFIGGERDGYDRVIDIWNYKEMIWRAGPM